MENVIPDYGKTMLACNIVASKYPTETVVKVVRTPFFRSPNPLRDEGRAAVAATISRSALVTVLCSVSNSVAKIATFLHYVWEQCREIRAIFGRFSRDSCTGTSNSAFQTIAIFARFSNNIRLFLSCISTWL